MRTHLFSALVIVALIALVTPVVALAVPPLPFTAYGTVKLNGEHVPAGFQVTAHCGGVQYASALTRLENAESIYGPLDIPGDDLETTGVKEGCSAGETVVFKIAGYSADQTRTWSSGSQTVNLTATPKGVINVNKTVNWNTVPEDPAQRFEICIQGPSYPTKNCKQVGPGNGTLTWNNLLNGDYAVSETDPGVAWTVTGGSQTVTVPLDGTANAAITNTRKLGSLQNTKTVQWNGVTPVTSQTFQICITGPSHPTGNCQTIGSSGGQLSWTSLIPGAYTVTETDPGAQWSVQVSGSPATVPVDGGSATSTVTNARKLGSLKITKTVDWNGIDPAAKNFEICITGPAPASTKTCKTFTSPGTLEQTWTNLVPGSYAVSETDPGSEWAVVVPAAPVNVPIDGGQATALVTNTRKLGSLAVTKTVNWNGVTPVTGQTFSICITGPSYATPNCQTATYLGGTLTWNNLKPGGYTVTETNPGNDWTVNISGSPASVPVDGGQATATVTNTRKRGSLQITKTVNWNGITPVSGQTFSICITGPSYATPNCQTFTYPGDLVKTWSNLIPGNYTVTETDPGAMWTVVLPASPVSVPTDGGQASASVSNTRKLGTLQVAKTVNWNGVTPVEGQTFQVCIQGPSYPTTKNCKTFTYPGGLTQSWSNLLPGDYTVTENDPGTMWTVVVPAAPVSVPADGTTANAAVSNTRKLGSLQMTKTVNWKGVTPVNGQTFSICIQGPSYPNTANCKTFTFPSGLVQTWNNLVPGVYTVTENNPGEEWAVTVDTPTVTVPADGGQASGGVSNNRKLGGLQATKNVDWLEFPPDPAKKFTICISGPSYPAPDKNCKEAGYQGGVLSWTNLIPGDYTVTETDPGAGWQVAITGGSPAKVPVSGGTVNATVSNARMQNGLLVTKAVNWNGITADTGKTFQICITGPSYPTPNCKTSDYDGGTLIWSGLAPGVYTVTETAPGAEWEVVISGSPATVPTEGNASASVTNSRKLGSLVVTKVVNWNGVTPEEGQAFEICATGPSYPGGNCRTFTYPNDLGESWLNLIPGSYTISEPNPGEAWTVNISNPSVVIPISGEMLLTSSVSNTRKRASVQVNAAVDWNGVAEVNGQTFQICLSGPSLPTPECKTYTYPGDLSKTWSNLIPGNYIVTQSSGAEWTATIIGSPAAAPVNGGTANAGVTFQRKRGALQVTKSVEWSGYTPDPGVSFTICITGPSYPGGDCKTAAHTGSVLTWSNLIPGSYAVSEPSPGTEWQVVINGSPATVPTNGGTANAGVANARKNSGLLVTKTVNWNGLTPNPSKTFEICIRGPSFPGAANCKTVDYDGGTLSWVSLLPGPYEVSETNPGAEWQVAIDNSGAIVPADGGNGSAGVINTRKLGGLQLTKIVIWGEAEVDPDQVFNLCIQGPSFTNTPNCKAVDYQGGMVSWSGLIPGVYTVSEAELGSNWQMEVLNLPVSVPADGGVGSAQVHNSFQAERRIYLPLVLR